MRRPCPAQTSEGRRRSGPPARRPVRAVAVALAASVALVGCDSGLVVDEQLTADTTALLRDTADTWRVAKGHRPEPFLEVCRRLGVLYADARAEGRRPDGGAVASALITEVHGRRYPALLELFDTYTDTEAYSQRGEEGVPDVIGKDLREKAEFFLMTLGVVLRSEPAIAEELERALSGAADPYAAVIDYRIEDSPSAERLSWIASNMEVCVHDAERAA